MDVTEDYREVYEKFHKEMEDEWKQHRKDEETNGYIYKGFMTDLAPRHKMTVLERMMFRRLAHLEKVTKEIEGIRESMKEHYARLTR